ncbi:MAG: hypothetical protein WKG06_18675 [Segetibacter sp.]
MKTYISLVILGVAIILTSCEKNITIPQPAYKGRVSIQSMIEKDSVPIVYFNRTVPYFDKKVTFNDLVIRNALITIKSSLGTDSLRLDSVYDRIYCEYDYYYKGTALIQSDKIYALTIKSGTDTYTATAQTNSIAPSIDSVSYTPTFSDLYGEHEGVIVYFKDIVSQTNFYRFEMTRYVDTTTQKASEKIVSPCLGRDSVRIRDIGRSVYSDEGLSGQQLKMVIEPAYTHKAGTPGFVYVTSFDKNAYDFFDQLDKQKQSQFNPFVEPVFLKDGQFGSKAIGYFSSKTNSVPVKFVFPE